MSVSEQEFLENVITRFQNNSIEEQNRHGINGFFFKCNENHRR